MPATHASHAHPHARFRSVCALAARSCSGFVVDAAGSEREHAGHGMPTSGRMRRRRPSGSAMKARMTVVRTAIGDIKPYGNANESPFGHVFAFVARVKVLSRGFGSASDDGIDCPTLQWNERIEWFEYDALDDRWRHRGDVIADMYQRHRASRTFRDWNEFRHTAAKDDRKAPVDLRRTASEKDAKHWIARNGFEWDSRIADRPGMGVRGGNRGGAGESLAVGAEPAASRSFRPGLFRRQPQSAGHTGTRDSERRADHPQVHREGDDEVGDERPG